MAKKHELNWYAPRKGWSKTIGKKRYYFQLGSCKGPDDQEGYRAALKEYLELRDKLDEKRAAKIEKRNEDDILPDGSNVVCTMAFMDFSRYDGEIDQITAKKKHITIQGVVNGFLDDRKILAEAGQISKGSYSFDKYKLANFLAYCNYKGTGLLSQVLTPEFLGAYKNMNLKALAQGDVAAQSVKHFLRTVKSLLIWAEDQGIIATMPARMRKYSNIKLPAPQPQFFTVEEVKRIYHAASDQQKIWMLLALNCGFVQSDIANLKHAQIDWETRIIKAPRHKTGVDSEHKLWVLTADLLRKAATDPEKSELVLLTKKGLPLIREHIDQDRPTRTDRIGHSFQVLLGKLQIKKPFKCFRKTGANEIAKQYQDKPFLTDLYLAHAEGGLKKHYARQHFDLLHEATHWLSTIYGFHGHMPGHFWEVISTPEDRGI